MTLSSNSPPPPPPLARRRNDKPTLSAYVKTVDEAHIILFRPRFEFLKYFDFMMRDWRRSELWRSSRPMREVLSTLKSPRLPSLVDRVSTNVFYYRSNYAMTTIVGAVMCLPFAYSMFWFMVWIVIGFGFAEVCVAPPVKLRITGLSENFVSAALVSSAVLILCIGIYLNPMFECTF